MRPGVIGVAYQCGSEGIHPLLGTSVALSWHEVVNLDDLVPAT